MLLDKYFLFAIIWLIEKCIFDNCLRAEKGVIDKGKLFERIGRKITGLFNGSWITEVILRLVIAHSFEGKNGLFC